MALQLYLEGLSLRGIERLLKISHATVLKWIRQWGKAIERLRREAEPKEARQVEIDELCSYIGEKKNKSGYGWMWIESGGKCWILWWETRVSGRKEDFMNA